MRDASVALESKDFTGAIAKLELAVELRPDFPQLLLDLAGAQAGGTLPFTGIPVWVPLLAGLGLLSCGYMLLRWKGRTSA